jgi:hypothetical protein
MASGFHCLYFVRMALPNFGQFFDITEVYAVESIPELMELTAEPAPAGPVGSGHSRPVEGRTAPIQLLPEVVVGAL